MLNNKNISNDLRTALIDIPHGEDTGKILPCQTKIDIFDSKCTKCEYSILKAVDVNNLFPEYLLRKIAE